MHTKATCLLLLLQLGLWVHAQRHSVVIHEIFPDPDPAVGLPDAEYVELRNTSQAPVSLAGWRLQTASATSGAFPAYILAPGSVVVVASRNNTGFFGANTIGAASFPALPNGSGTLVLRNASGQNMHAVAYAETWYHDAVKAQGGWSLEMIDATNACEGAPNWKASSAASGGTPGSPNSVAAANPDQTPPELLTATAPAPNQLLLHFSELLDSTGAAKARYRLQPEINVVSSVPQGPLFNEVLLTLSSPMQAGTPYLLTVAALTDCAGNAIGNSNNVPAGLPQPVQAGDVVINEILFNPKDDGSDYVELYNKSRKIIDLSELWTGNRTGANTFDQLQQLSAVPRYVFPETYVVLTKDEAWVKSNYLVQNPSALLPVANMPSLSDNKGSLVVLAAQNGVVDELNYSDSWHFPLISNPEGVALERIDPFKATQDKNNWTSAAAAAGFGTPGYRNSQYRQVPGGSAAIHITPKVVSPDGDGLDDFCTISFQLDAPNYVANVTLFDAAGHRVRYLVQNHTLAQNGYWRWDCLGDNNRRLASGTYILLTELFNLQGKRQQFKQTVVLAQRP